MNSKSVRQTSARNFAKPLDPAIAFQVKKGVIQGLLSTIFEKAFDSLEYEHHIPRKS
jgi:hypothetical protein